MMLPTPSGKYGANDTSPRSELPFQGNRMNAAIVRADIFSFTHKDLHRGLFTAFCFM
jgi:hypothetical protein